MFREKTKQQEDDEKIFDEHLARKNKYGTAKVSKAKRKMIRKSKKTNRKRKGYAWTS